MKIRNLSLASVSMVAALFGLGHVTGCGGPAANSPADEAVAAALAECHLDDGTVEADALIRACDPGDVKKTTICHVPPGNPSNAHTLCIGNSAVPAHLNHHAGDAIGACRSETTCPTPSSGTGGLGGHDPAPANGGSCGGPGGRAGGSGGAAAGGSGGVLDRVQ